MHNKKPLEQLRSEAIEFLQRQYMEVAEQKKQLDEYQESLAQEIIRQGGVVPDAETPLYELVERELIRCGSMQLEDELIDRVVSANGWLSVRNPVAQIQKAITQSCKSWKNTPTKFFRHDRWIGLYLWKSWLGGIEQNIHDKHEFREALICVSKLPLNEANRLTESLIQSGVLSVSK